MVVFYSYFSSLLVRISSFFLILVLNFFFVFLGISDLLICEMVMEDLGNWAGEVWMRFTLSLSWRLVGAGSESCARALVFSRRHGDLSFF